jgi:hypothetical protein
VQFARLAKGPPRNLQGARTCAWEAGTRLAEHAKTREKTVHAETRRRGEGKEAETNIQIFLDRIYGNRSGNSL